jgi:hypothetical protein
LARYFAPGHDATLLLVLFTGICLSVIAMSGMVMMAPWLKPLSGVVGIVVGAAVYEFKTRSEAAVLRWTPKTEAAVVVEQVDPAPVVQPDRLQETLGIIVRRAHTGKKYTREAMVAENLMTQPEWNVANAVLKMAGLRDGLRYTGDGVEADMDLLSQNLRVDGEAVWVRVGRGQWSKIDLAAANAI